MAPYRSGPSRDWLKVKNPDSPAMVRHQPRSYRRVDDFTSSKSPISPAIAMHQLTSRSATNGIARSGASSCSFSTTSLTRRYRLLRVSSRPYLSRLTT
jgi:hypothetical protein